MDAGRVGAEEEPWHHCTGLEHSNEPAVRAGCPHPTEAPQPPPPGAFLPTSLHLRVNNYRSGQEVFPVSLSLASAGLLSPNARALPQGWAPEPSGIH